MISEISSINAVNKIDIVKEGQLYERTEKKQLSTNKLPEQFGNGLPFFTT